MLRTCPYFGSRGRLTTGVNDASTLKGSLACGTVPAGRIDRPQPRHTRSSARLLCLRQHNHFGPGKIADYLERFRSAVESFNGKLRDECLNGHVFASVAEAEIVLD